MLISSADIPDLFGGKWPFQFDTLKLTITPAPLRTENWLRTQLGCPKMPLAEIQYLKYPTYHHCPKKLPSRFTDV